MRRLIVLVDKGDLQAMAVAFDSLALLDGGDLEDVMRALAARTSDQPGEVLAMMQARAFDTAAVRGLVRMMPLSSVDQPEERRSILRKRIEALESVTDSRLSDLRSVAVEALTKSLDETTSSGTGE